MEVTVNRKINLTTMYSNGGGLKWSKVDGYCLSVFLRYYVRAASLNLLRFEKEDSYAAQEGALPDKTTSKERKKHIFI